MKDPNEQSQAAKAFLRGRSALQIAREPYDHFRLHKSGKNEVKEIICFER